MDQRAAAMELLPDGAYVRLQSRGRTGMYLHADEDGVGVSLSPHRASLNAAWRVHRIVRRNVPYVLLYGAAYGRYLAVAGILDPAPEGHIGQRVVQADYEDLDENTVRWTPIRVEPGEDQVLLRNISGNRALRANGKRRKWLTGVTADNHLKRTSMVHPLGRFLDLFRRRTVPKSEERMVLYSLADDAGNINEPDWDAFKFQGRSVFILRSSVAPRVGRTIFNITVCTRAGLYGRLTPLVTDLPRSQRNMNIIALAVGSPADEELEYPDVGAP